MRGEYAIPCEPREKIASSIPVNSTQNDIEDGSGGHQVQVATHSEAYSEAPQSDKSPITPNQQKQSNQPGTDKFSPSTKNMITSLQWIEGHCLSVEDHASRAHILYSLSNLNSLPRRSSSTISYLNASMRKAHRTSESPASQTGEQEEIESRVRSTEKRIAHMPMQLHNRFQILQ